MNTQELLELASLDALGLLEEDERRAFDEAFRAAPPALQAQIRREQTRFARIDSLLPDVEPPIGLRARVLAAVREAMHAVAGRAQSMPAVIPPIVASRGVNRIWRAAAVGCAAAAVTFAITTLRMDASYRELQDALRNNQMVEQLSRDYGVRFEQSLLSSRTRFVQFDAIAPDLGETAARAPFRGEAVLLWNPESQTGHFLCRNLPEDAGEYHLVVIDEEGNERQAVLTFKPTGSRINREIEKLPLQPGLRLAITAPSGTVLRSANL